MTGHLANQDMCRFSQRNCQVGADLEHWLYLDLARQAGRDVSWLRQYHSLHSLLRLVA